MIKDTRPLVERVMARVRNNPVFATLILFGILLSSVASFTDALNKLKTAFFTDTSRASIAGAWLSDELTDPRTRLGYRYVFQLKTDGARVYGGAKRVFPKCEGAASNICAGTDREVGLVDGKLDRKALSFGVDWGEIANAAPWTYIKVKESFHGTVDGTAIRFVVDDDQGTPAREFTATLRQ